MTEAMPEELQRQMLQNLSVTVLLLDHDLKMLAVNAAGERMFEKSAHHVEGQHLHELMPRDASFVACIQRIIAGGAQHAEREVRLELNGSKSLLVDCVLTPINEADQPGCWVMELFDIDRRARMSREDSLAAQYNVTHSLMRGMAHEIKNPLGGLRGAAQLLARQLPSEELQEYTATIIQEADRLGNILDRMMQPVSAPQMGDLNLHEVMERVYKLVRAEAQPVVSVVRDYDPSLPRLAGDREQLIQAVLNVARNALQALPEGGEMVLRTRSERQVTIGHQLHRLVARIDVIDNGPGVPEDIREQVFFPMISGKDGGSGLGLGIAQSIIRHHQGLIEFESEPGKTVFSIWLPLSERS